MVFEIWGLGLRLVDLMSLYGDVFWGSFLWKGGGVYGGGGGGGSSSSSSSGWVVMTAAAAVGGEFMVDWGEDFPCRSHGKIDKK